MKYELATEVKLQNPVCNLLLFESAKCKVYATGFEKAPNNKPYCISFFLAEKALIIGFAMQLTIDGPKNAIAI